MCAAGVFCAAPLRRRNKSRRPDRASARLVPRAYSALRPLLLQEAAKLTCCGRAGGRTSSTVGGGGQGSAARRSSSSVLQMSTAKSSATAATQSSPKVLLRSLSQGTGKKTLAEVSTVAASVLSHHHLPRFQFFIGVLNALLKAFLLGAIPGYFWLYATLQFPIMLGMLVPLWARRGKLLYFTELCWVMNMGGWIFLCCEAFAMAGRHHLFGLVESSTILFSTPARVEAARTFFGVANGPLALTVLMNGNALVFHDLERTLSFFIHFSPALVSWTLRWRADASVPLLGLDDAASATVVGGASSFEVVTRPLMLYFCWWFVYGVWLLVRSTRLLVY